MTSRATVLTWRRIVTLATLSTTLCSGCTGFGPKPRYQQYVASIYFDFVANCYETNDSTQLHPETEGKFCRNGYRRGDTGKPHVFYATPKNPVVAEQYISLIVGIPFAKIDVFLEKGKAVQLSTDEYGFGSALIKSHQPVTHFEFNSNNKTNRFRCTPVPSKEACVVRLVPLNQL